MHLWWIKSTKRPCTIGERRTRLERGGWRAEEDRKKKTIFCVFNILYLNTREGERSYCKSITKVLQQFHRKKLSFCLQCCRIYLLVLINRYFYDDDSREPFLHSDLLHTIHNHFVSYKIDDVFFFFGLMLLWREQKCKKDLCLCVYKYWNIFL